MSVRLTPEDARAEAMSLARDLLAAESAVLENPDDAETGARYRKVVAEWAWRLFRVECRSAQQSETHVTRRRSTSRGDELDVDGVAQVHRAVDSYERFHGPPKPSLRDLLLRSGL